jgi:ribosomal protein L37E
MDENKKEIKKIKIIEPTPIVYTYTCRKCGSNSFRNVVVHTHKFGGPGLGNNKVRVCTNCGWGENIIDEAGKPTKKSS